MTVIVIDKSQFIVHELAGKSESVLQGHVSFSGEEAAERSILIAGSSCLLSVEDGSDIFQCVMGEEEMLSICHSVFLPACHHQNARSPRIRRIPQIALYKSGFWPHQIQFSYLQIVPVQEPRVAGSASIDDHFLFKASSLIVVAAGDGDPAVFTGEGDGAVVGIIGNFPNPH